MLHYKPAVCDHITIQMYDSCTTTLHSSIFPQSARLFRSSSALCNNSLLKSSEFNLGTDVKINFIFSLLCILSTGTFGHAAGRTDLLFHHQFYFTELSQAITRRDPLWSRAKACPPCLQAGCGDVLQLWPTGYTPPPFPLKQACFAILSLCLCRGAREKEVFESVNPSVHL